MHFNLENLNELSLLGILASLSWVRNAIPYAPVQLMGRLRKRVMWQFSDPESAELPRSLPLSDWSKRSCMRA